MRLCIVICLFISILSFNLNAQMAIGDSASTSEPSYLEYNGLNYTCAPDSAPAIMSDSLITYWKDSTGKIQHVRKYVQLMNWLQCAVQSVTYTIVVNIPSADLFVYERGQRVFYSRVVVGKPATPTHTISASIKNVVLYPYWMVPKSIATKELLPQIKRNRAFLQNNNFQVLDNKGKVVDPTTIDWSLLSRAYFPYQLRQSTGCDNSLGVLKFDFYNPFSAYLHDTPEKYLFSRKNRFYSHGCIRVERAMELAQLLLRENRIAVDTLINNPCRLNVQPDYISLKMPANIFIVYSRAWPARRGELQFYNNVYHKSE
jgi:murein L,D-transpeptidase YcbB/YkuD